MFALCVFGTMNMQGFGVEVLYALYIYYIHLFIKLHNIQTQQSKTNANLNFEEIDKTIIITQA